MRDSRKWKALLMVVVLLLSVLAVPNGEVEAASKITVKKIASADSLTGKKTIKLAKGKKAGTAKITVASAKNSKKKAVITVKVMKGKVTSIKFGKKSATLKVGDSTKLKPTVKVSTGGSKDVVWTTSNKKVATVKNGTVKAVKEGAATITVKAADGTGKKAVCKVTVKKKDQAGNHDSDVAALKKIIKQQRALGAKVPENINDKSYMWTKSGRLRRISWDNRGLKGKLSTEGLPALELLFCCENDLSSLDVSKNKALIGLECSENPLKSLDVSKNTALTGLICYDNNLSSLDVSRNTALRLLHCSENSLKNLNVSKNIALTSLSCGDNNLSSLDVSRNTALESLSCDNNNLSNLDVSKCKLLTRLFCSENQLKSLDVSKCQKTIEVSCDWDVVVKR